MMVDYCTNEKTTPYMRACFLLCVTLTLTPFFLADFLPSDEFIVVTILSRDNHVCLTCLL